MLKQIKLSKGKYAVVNSCDHDLQNVQWMYNPATGYAARHQWNKETKRYDGQLMHRVILARKLCRTLKPKELTDHINRDKLDNRRENLRLADRAENAWNSSVCKSVCKGVSIVKGLKHKKYRARIDVKGKTKHLGYFDNLIEAASAYNRAVQRYHGVFGWLNRL